MLLFQISENTIDPVIQKYEASNLQGTKLHRYTLLCSITMFRRCLFICFNPRICRTTCVTFGNKKVSGNITWCMYYLHVLCTWKEPSYLFLPSRLPRLLHLKYNINTWNNHAWYVYILITCIWNSAD